MKVEEILNLYLDGKIKTKEFNDRLLKHININNCDKLLELSLNKLTSVGIDLFSSVWWIIATNFSYDIVDPLVKKYLAIQVGHFQHEDMIEYFHNNIIDPEVNVNILVSLIENPPKYFLIDDRENVFIEKCLFTIAKQPTFKANEVLLVFSSSDNETISRASKLYLEKLVNKPQ